MSEPTRLKDREFHIGILRDISESDDGLLARMEIQCHNCGQLYDDNIEIPFDLRAKLQPLMGKRIIISRIGGMHYVGEARVCTQE